MTRQAGPRHQTAILAIICISYFMVILDNSIIFTGIPRILAAMSFSATGLAWVQDAYTLVFGGLLLLGARAGDILGRRRMFVAGLVFFGGASFLVGIAPYAWWLIAARALQGIGAAILAPSSLALLTASFGEGEPRTRAVAAYSAVAGIGGSAGLVVGGVLADLVSWRAGFFLNVPIGLAMLAAAHRFLAPDTAERHGRFDLLGAFGSTLGMTGIVFAVIHSADAGWTNIGTFAPFAVGVSFLIGFVVNEARASQPIMPLRLFADQGRVGAYLVRLLYLGAMIGFFFFTTQYLQDARGYTPLQAGFAFLPMTIVNFGLAVVVNRVLRRLGLTWTLIAGVAFTLAGLAWLSRITGNSSYLTSVAAPMVLIGVGQGLAFAPMTSAGLAGVTGEQAGAASGVINTFHQLGSAVGLSILTAVAARAVTPGASSRDAVVERVGAALTGSSVLLALALVLVIVLIAPSQAAASSVASSVASSAAAPATGQARPVDDVAVH